MAPRSPTRLQRRDPEREAPGNLLLPPLRARAVGVEADRDRTGFLRLRRTNQGRTGLRSREVGPGWLRFLAHSNNQRPIYRIFILRRHLGLDIYASEPGPVR